MTSSELSEQLAAFMKCNGYKKNKHAWRKDNNEIVLAISLQKSRWDIQDFYICYGVTVKEVDDTFSFNATNYPIRERLNCKSLSIEQVKYSILLWEDKYNSVLKIAKAAIENRLPLQTDVNIIQKLTTGHFLKLVLEAYSRQ